MEKICGYEASMRYDEFLDEIYPPVKFGELTWDASRVIKELDPVAYECGLNDWADGEGLELV